jgi:very-short-patch-repair endonuclease
MRNAKCEMRDDACSADLNKNPLPLGEGGSQCEPGEGNLPVTPRRSGKKPDRSSLQRVRQLRQNSSFLEKLLWSRLRSNAIAGCKFRRQHAIGPFIVDFYCHETQLVIELDGDSHQGRATYDRQRTEYLESLGLLVLRIDNDDVITDIDSVLEAILKACNKSTAMPSPRPSPRGRGSNEEPR